MQASSNCIYNTNKINVHICTRRMSLTEANKAIFVSRRYNQASILHTRGITLHEAELFLTLSVSGLGTNRKQIPITFSHINKHELQSHTKRTIPMKSSTTHRWWWRVGSTIHEHQTPAPDTSQHHWERHDTRRHGSHRNNPGHTWEQSFSI